MDLMVEVACGFDDHLSLTHLESCLGQELLIFTTPEVLVRELVVKLITVGGLNAVHLIDVRVDGHSLHPRAEAMHLLEVLHIVEMGGCLLGLASLLALSQACGAFDS